MKVSILAVLAAFFVVGCSHKQNIGTFSVVSAHTITSPQRAEVASDEFCTGVLSMTEGLYRTRQEATVNLLNKAKKQGLPADAVANPTFTIKGGFAQICANVTGKPVGLKLVK